MDNVFLIDPKNPLLAKWKNEFQCIPITVKEWRDPEYHDFIIDIVRTHSNIAKLILPLSSSGFDGLTFGLHVRLTRELRDKSLMPLIYVSNENMERILLKNKSINNFPALLLLTRGVALITENDDIGESLIALKPLDESDLRKELFNILRISNPYETGRHSIANKWGALRLDNCLALNAFDDNAEIKKLGKQLYFKYLSRQVRQEKETVIIGKKETTIDATGKKILLIDDEAGQAWEPVLKKIFHIYDDFFVRKYDVGTFDQFIKNAEQDIHKDWDLILLDLRLNPEEEDKSDLFLSPEKFSGAKLLQKIKKINPGTQVIIFTASNKAWNMHHLHNIGADGYFIKESPEILFADEFTLKNYENFQRDVQRCFENGYLRQVYSSNDAIKAHLNSLKKSLRKLTDLKLSELLTECIEYVKLHLETAFTLIRYASLHDDHKQKEYYAYAFLSYYFIIEKLISDAVYRDKNDKYKFQCGSSLKNWYSEDGKKYEEVSETHEKFTGNYKDSLRRKMACLCFDILKIERPNETVVMSEIWKIIGQRNDYIHPTKRKLPKADITRDGCKNISELIHKILTAINERNLCSLFRSK